MDIPPIHKDIRVLIADSCRLFRAGVISLIGNHNGVQIIDEAANGKELFDKYFLSLPDIILTDISLPIISGMEAVYKIRKISADVKPLFLTVYDNEEYLCDCLKVGGKGLVNKNVMTGELINAIYRVFEGKYYFAKYVNKVKLKEFLENYDPVRTLSFNNMLTSREKDIIFLIGEGLSSSEISERLHISKRTVDTFRTNLMQKLKIKSLAELIKFSIRFVIFHGSPI